MLNDELVSAADYFHAAHVLLCCLLVAVAGLVACFFVWAAVLRRREYRLRVRHFDAQMRTMRQFDSELSLVSHRLAQQKASTTAPWKCLQGGKTDGPDQG